MTSLSLKFPHEQYDFTPWLFDNLHILTSIGLDVKGKETEAWCRTGRVDILAEDTDASPVIIENQYGFSDGSHFRRLLGYMQDFGSRKAIWIAEEFNAKYIEKVERAAKSGIDISLVRASLDDSSSDVVFEFVERFAESGTSLANYLPSEELEQPFNSINDACAALSSYWSAIHDPIISVCEKNWYAWIPRSAWHSKNI